MKHLSRAVTTLLIAALCLTVARQCAAARSVSAKPRVSGAKLAPACKLTIVAGQPFEPVQSRGSSKLSVVLCPEETEPVTFTASYSKTLENVRVAAVGDFAGPGKIARSNFEVNRVAGDELANQVSASSGVVFTEANIGPSPVQFWVNVTVPRRTPPGTYKGWIGFYYQGKTFDTVPVKVEVLPLRLLGSSKQYALYTSYGPTGVPATNLEGKAYCAFLSAFKRLGFRAVSVNSHRSKCADALSAYCATKLSGTLPILVYAFGEATTISESEPVVVSEAEPRVMLAGWSGSSGWIKPTVDEVRSILDLSKSSGFTSVVFFCADNPVSESAIQTAKEQAETFHRARARAVARISEQRALEELGPVLDGIDYHVATPYVRSLINKETTRTSSKWEWYWWDARSSASDNRVYAGVGLWKSGLDGCMPAWMPVAGREPVDGVSSMLGEALREGIDDTRYITTYMKALRELKDLKRETDKDYIAATEAYLDSFMAQPLNRITPAKLRKLKARMAEYSLKLAARM